MPLVEAHGAKAARTGPPHKTRKLSLSSGDYRSCSCTSGICDDTCNSSIIAMRRSN